MKNRITRTVALLICVLLLVPAAACAPDGRVAVVSDDYPGLEYIIPGEFSEEAYLLSITPGSEYYHVGCTLGVRDGRLTVSDTVEDRTSYVCRFNNGYFAGVDLGEWDGWVEYRPYHGALPEAGDPVTVVNENCFGIIATDKNNGFILSGKPELTVAEGRGTARITKITLPSTDGRWEWETIAEYEGAVRTYFYSGDTSEFYIITAEKLLSVAPGGSVSVLSGSALLEKILVTSIVVFEGDIWCGTQTGIYRYSPATGEETWYPIDFPSYLPDAARD